MTSDEIVRTFLLLVEKYGISLSSKEDWNANNVQLPSDGKISYTDGSKRDDLTGARVYRRRGIGETIILLGR